MSFPPAPTPLAGLQRLSRGRKVTTPQASRTPSSSTKQPSSVIAKGGQRRVSTFAARNSASRRAMLQTPRACPRLACRR